MKYYRLFLVLAGIILISLAAKVTIAAPDRQVGPPLEIWWGFNDDRTPAVAYSTQSTNYLVAYETNAISGTEVLTDTYNIAVRYVNSSGSLIGTAFFVSHSTTNTQRNPDVTYDPFQNRFLVVWDEYHCEPSASTNQCGFIIKGRLLYGDANLAITSSSLAAQDASPPQPEPYLPPAKGQQAPLQAASYLSPQALLPGYAYTMATGISKTVSAGYVYELCDPAITYNNDDHIYQIVYQRRAATSEKLLNCKEKEHEDLYGQLANSATFTPGPLTGGTGFNVLNTGETYNVSNPDVAWGPDGERFMAIFGSPTDNKIRVSYLYDIFRGGGTTPQYAGGVYAITPLGSVTGDASTPAIAYDPVAKAFVMVYTHHEGTLSSTIYGQRLKPAYSAGILYNSEGPFGIETFVGGYFSAHDGPDITFSGSGPDGDGIAVAYRSYTLQAGVPNQFWVHGRMLHGTARDDRVWLRYSLLTSSHNTQEEPTIACSPQECLAAWQERWETDDQDHDVSGQVWPRQINLPVLEK